MINSNPPERTTENPEELNQDETVQTDESIITHTDVPDEQEQKTAIKKLMLFFKSKPSESPAEIGPVEPQKPARTSGQGLRRKGKASPKNPDPDMRLRAFMAPPMSSAPEEPASKKSKILSGERTRKAYWDITGALSLVVNAILIAVLVVMAGQIKNLKTMMDGLLGGLYSNFVEMDKANISTTIPVQAQIPIVFDLPVQQNTSVTLTDAVNIPHTGVVINSGGLSINAPATITLPAGTSLPIALNMDIPVQLTIPISLEVPVNIPMNQTMLHQPFTGLQQTIKPLYCIINKNAQYPQGIFICNSQNTPATGTP